MNRPELTVVVPVYNESKGVGAVLRDWSERLDRLNIDYVVHAYDDGSLDDTPDVLREAAAGNPRIRVTRHDNVGHGPTILRGYRDAAGEWILQIDGDDNVGPEPFGSFWSRRGDYDLLLGARCDRDLSLARRVVSRCARWTVDRLFGVKLEDVNVPYRLMRKAALESSFAELPDDVFAPNVVLTGIAVRSGLRVFQTPVKCRSVTRPNSSLTPFRLARAVGKSFIQTVALRYRLPNTSRHE